MRIILLWFVVVSSSMAQGSYFPPINGEWDTQSPDELGFCPDSVASLYDYLASTDTKAFLLLQDGKIVLEQYFGNFTQTSNWYWASAGKTLTAFLLGLAQEQGYLNIQDPSSQYLGPGWTFLPSDKEEAINIFHQLTMTTGLDDGGDVFCTDPECLTYLADAGERWAYHNAPYTLLTEIIPIATGESYNDYTSAQLYATIGMQGAWIKSGYNHVHWSRARSMARFGLLIANQGIWDGDTLMHDQSYFKNMIRSSQSLNESYGYLWWLNGQPSFMLPGSQFVFSGSLFPEAAEDAFFALGKNAQILGLLPAKGQVVVRMGNDPGTDFISIKYARTLFKKIEDLQCFTGTDETATAHWQMKVFPNPTRDVLVWESPEVIDKIEIWDSRGKVNAISKVSGSAGRVAVQHLPKGMYILKAYGTLNAYQSKFYVH